MGGHVILNMRFDALYWRFGVELIANLHYPAQIASGRSLLKNRRHGKLMDLTVIRIVYKIYLITLLIKVVAKLLFHLEDGQLH